MELNILVLSIIHDATVQKPQWYTIMCYTGYQVLFLDCRPHFSSIMLMEFRAKNLFYFDLLWPQHMNPLVVPVMLGNVQLLHFIHCFQKGLFLCSLSTYLVGIEYLILKPHNPQSKKKIDCGILPLGLRCLLYHPPQCVCIWGKREWGATAVLQL